MSLKLFFFILCWTVFPQQSFRTFLHQDYQDTVVSEVQEQEEEEENTEELAA